MNKTQPTPEEITAVVSEQPDLYQPTVQPLDAVQDNGYFPIEVDAEDKELAAPSLAKLATPSSDRNWLQRFKVAAKTAVSNILNGQMTHNVALGNKKITFGKNKEEIEFGRRMASEAKRQIEEVMDGTEELTAEEAETWAAALGGGSVSMVDFAANLALLRGLGAGSVGAQLGAGWLAGRAGYEEGTMSDIDKYIAETGDKELKNYKGDKKAFAVNVASGAIQGSIEAATSGLGRYLINNPLAKKVLGKTGNDAIRKLASTAVGRTLAAGANESVNNAFEEWTQALTGNIAEIVKGNEEFSMDNILNGAGQAAGVGALLGWVATPVMQEYGRRKTRDWISDKLRKASEEKGIPLTEAEIKDASNDLVGVIESKGVQQVSDNYDKINQLAGAESDLAQTLSRVFEDLVNQGQIKFRQATPDEIRQAGLDWANYMQATALLDSLDREIPISAHPLFNAVAEADRIFLEGRDPGTGDLLPLDINNAQVRELANQIEDYIEQNRETRQAEEASKLVALREADMRARQETIQELERAAIAELEKEQAANNQERITELQQQITELQHQMDLLREERDKYAQERAAQGRVSIKQARAQETKRIAHTKTQNAIGSFNSFESQVVMPMATEAVNSGQVALPQDPTGVGYDASDFASAVSDEISDLRGESVGDRYFKKDDPIRQAAREWLASDERAKANFDKAKQLAKTIADAEKAETEQAAQTPDDMLYQKTPYDKDTIVVDGVKRTVYNSNGERIATTEEALTNFWRWFGNSKVVDDQGRPMVVYHSTEAEFDAFELQRGGGNEKAGWGFYTKSEKGHYFNTKEHQYGLYVKLDKPLVINYPAQTKTIPAYKIMELAEQIPDETNRIAFLETYEKGVFDYDGDVLEWLSDAFGQETEQKKQYIKTVKDVLGIDGVILGFGKNDIWAVFYDANQTKNVENTGEFGIGVNNMYHQDQVVKKVGEDRTNANKWLKEQKKVVDAAVDYYGLTDDINEAGYILPDGGLLDFSGKNMGGMPGRRAFDHREIAAAFDEEVIGKPSPFPELVVMEEFVNAGNIRFLPESGTFLMAHKPTPEQYRTIERIMDQRNGEIQIEFVSDAEKWGEHIAENFYYETPEYSSIQDVKRLANAFFDGEGVSSEMLTFADEWGTLYQPGYVSLPVPEMIGGKLDVDTFRGTGESGARWGDGNYVLADMALDKKYYFDEWNKVKITYDGKDMHELAESDGRFVRLLNEIINRIHNNPTKLPKALTEIKEMFDVRLKEMTERLEYAKNRIEKFFNSVEEEYGPEKAKAYREIFDLSLKINQLEADGKAEEAIKSRQERAELYEDATTGVKIGTYEDYSTRYSFYVSALMGLNIAKKNVNLMDELDLSKLEAKNSASLYRVEVPEAKFLLDMQLPFDKQSDFVKGALLAISKDLDINLSSRYGKASNMNYFIASEIAEKIFPWLKAKDVDYLDSKYVIDATRKYLNLLYTDGQLFTVQQIQQDIETVVRVRELDKDAFTGKNDKGLLKKQRFLKKIKDFIAGIEYVSHYVLPEEIQQVHVYNDIVWQSLPIKDKFRRWIVLDKEFQKTVRIYLFEGVDAADAYVDSLSKDKPLYERLTKVWDKTKERIEEGKINKIVATPKKDLVGEEIQERLNARLGYDSIATRKKLYEYGILGNTYYGGRDGRGFVIFSGEDAPVQEKIFQDQPQAKLIATHNMSKEGLERALDLGGLVMPSMAITKFTDGAFTGYGEISFIGDAILANPTRTTDAYDRDAWTPMINNIVHQFTEGGVERLKALVEEAKQKNPRDTNTYSVYRMNIEKGMSDDPRSNTMAVELFSILHDIPREQARQNITYNWGEEKTEMHKQYLEWFNDKLLAETKAFIYEGYTPSGNIRLKPLTLDNLVASLKKQDRFGRMTGDFFTPSDIIKMNLVRFKNIGEIRDAQGRLVSRDEAYEAYKEIGSDFYNLASELNKHNVKENDYTSSDQRLAWALILEKGTLEERLAKQNLKNDAESVKKVKKFIKDVKNIKVPYFEVKPRRAVKFYEFSGVILPKGEPYDNLAARLEEEGVLNIYRATTPEEKTAALKDLTEKRPWTLLQNKKTSKSTTGLGTEHRGGYDPMTKAIIFNKTSDLTTLFHESAHYWFDRNLRYYRTGLASPEWKKKWEDVMKELGATPNARGTIPVSAIRSASEKFARSMEAYLREGKYESAAIQWAHQDYANMVKRVYRNIWSTYWGLDDLSPAVKQWFDMFGLKTDDATTAFAEEDQIETSEQMVGAVIAEDATEPDVDAETKTIVADAGAQVVENPATQEIAIVPADPFETGKKARSKLPRSAEAATGVSMDDIIYNRRSMSDAFKAAQQLVNTDPVRAWEILKAGQEMVDGLYAGDIYRALVAKYQAENNPTMLKNVVQAFAGAARRAGRSVKAFDLESPRISFEKTISSLDKIFGTKKNDKRIEKVKNELKEFLHDPSALRVGWEEFKNIVGCK